MRMWLGVHPRHLCRQHLLGEHKELHMLAGCMSRGKNVQGYVARRLVRPTLLYQRHADIVVEMRRRGYQHKSPLPVLTTGQLLGASALNAHYSQLYKDRPSWEESERVNRWELVRRCKACRERVVAQEGFLFDPEPCTVEDLSV